MFNRSYQKARAQYQRAYQNRHEEPACCDNVWWGTIFAVIFKNCIHIFVLLIIVSFTGMLYSVSNSNIFKHKDPDLDEINFQY